MHSVLLVIHLMLALALVGIVLVQRSDGEGMGAMGGGGGGNSFLTGRAQANVMTRATAILAALFMLTSLGLSLVGRKTSGSLVDTIAPPAATAPVTPAAPAPSVPVAK